MNVAANMVVSINYTLKNEEGEILQTMGGEEPFAFLCGHDNVIPGLEEALEGKSVGDKVVTTIAPEKAYGHYDERLKSRVPMKHFKKHGKLNKGDQVTVQTDHGPRVVTILKVGMYSVDVDANHPLVGQTLTFDVEVTDIRQATPEEISHGHAHGVGGHQH